MPALSDRPFTSATQGMNSAWRIVKRFGAPPWRSRHQNKAFPPAHPRANNSFFLLLQDISEDLKLGLNRTIELALADQSWEALAAQLARNDHLNVRPDEHVSSSSCVNLSPPLLARLSAEPKLLPCCLVAQLAKCSCCLMNPETKPCRRLRGVWSLGQFLFLWLFHETELEAIAPLCTPEENRTQTQKNVARAPRVKIFLTDNHPFRKNPDLDDKPVRTASRSLNGDLLTFPFPVLVRWRALFVGYRLGLGVRADGTQR